MWLALKPRDTRSKFYSEQFEGKRTVGRTRRMWMANVLQYFLETVFEGVLCVYLTRIMMTGGLPRKTMHLVP